MRVLHALAPAPFGGLERVVQMLARAQSESGHQVTVLGVVPPAPESHPFFDGFRAANIDAMPLAVDDRAWGREFRLLTREIRARRPDIVHTHGYRSDVLAGWAARRTATPVVATAHGFTGGSRKNRVYEWLQVASYRRGAHVIAVSAPLSDELRRRNVPPGRVHLIRNAWVPDGDFLNREAAREVLGIRGSGPTVGWVGRIGHEKGCDLAVRALADLPGVRLSIVGDGARRGDLETLASEVEVADRITWHGVVRRADLLLRGFDVLLLSSRTEGTPIIILEALAAGVPIVATRVGGVPNILQHEKDAILVPPEDPSALARAVQVCLSDTASSLRRVENGRVTVESEFGIERWVRRHEEVYDRAMGKGGA